MISRNLAFFFSILLLGFPALAQDKSTYYTVTHPDEFHMDWKGFYDNADQWTAIARGKLPHTLDLPYGKHPKQKLDIYLPEKKPSKAPIFLFLHGGGFREGDRAHYGFVALPLAEHGVITAVASYRLTTQGFFYPSQPEDVENVIAWIYENIEEYGGDPQRIYVGGHSAGAILSGHVAVRSDWLKKKGLPENLIKGCAPISGPYDLRTGTQWSSPEGDSRTYAPRDKQEAASPILNVQKAPPNCVVAIGSLEEKYIDSSSAFVDAIKGKGGLARLLVLEGMDHDQTGLALYDGEGLLVKAILRVIQGR